MKKPKILVVGSLVMDLIVSLDRIPNAGETILGTGFTTAPGGKGANQAVQAARIGADVTMVGKVGKDAFGHELIESLRSAGADVSHILMSEDAASAIGNILLLKDGEKTLNNRIIVVSGANMQITPSDVAFLKTDIANYDMLMLQMEIPMEINELVAGYAFDCGVPVMLNSAPSNKIPENLLSKLTYISPNEHEAADITGIAIEKTDGKINRAQLQDAVSALHKKGVKNVIITLGDSGAAISDGTEMEFHPAVDGINAVDPTAAGDSFVSAFCVSVCAGFGHSAALSIANHTAAVTVSSMGAQPSIPKLEKILALMKKSGLDESELVVIKSQLTGGN